MGTYTTNYNLFMPTVGETGWGTLVNGNFTTIDTTMKGLSNRITAIESEVNGNLSCTSVTTSGKVTANGGITSTTGTFSGAVTGASFNGATISANKFNGATIDASGNVTGVKGTFSGAVTGSTFNNVPIKKNGTYTVTPLSSFVTITSNTLLPLDANGNKYTGSIQINYPITAADFTIVRDTTRTTITLAANTPYTITFTNIRMLGIIGSGVNSAITMSAYTLS